jgi:hypothetical protein
MTNKLDKLFDDISDILVKSYQDKDTTKIKCKLLEKEVTTLAKKSQLYTKVKTKCERLDSTYLKINMYTKTNNKENYKVTEFRLKPVILKVNKNGKK